jgi:glycosyltransferase involved in cell wall biosynthesis
MPDFSIVIPCFNAEKTLPDTLASIQAQKYPSWEVILVDDGSTDNTRAIIKAAARRDRRIILARNTGKGPSAARNMGALTLARGNIVAFCDADDLWSPDKLTELKIAFEDFFTDAVYGKVGFFKDSPLDVTTYSTVPTEPLSIPVLLGENPVCTMSNLAIRRTSFERTGGFNPEIVHNEDLEWLVRLVGSGARLVGVQSCLTLYRTSTSGLSANLSAMAAGRVAVLQTAARFGYIASATSHAVYQRYLARRSLRLGQGRIMPLRLALRGLAQSPVGFFNPPRRGALTLAGALCAVVLPTPVTRRLFSR